MNLPSGPVHPTLVEWIDEHGGNYLMHKIYTEWRELNGHLGANKGVGTITIHYRYGKIEKVVSKREE